MSLFRMYDIDDGQNISYVRNISKGSLQMTTETDTWSTTAQKFAPGNFVTTWFPELGRNAHGVTRAIENPQEANPRVLVKWMHDLSEEWVRAEYIYLAN